MVPDFAEVRRLDGSVRYIPTEPTAAQRREARIRFVRDSYLRGDVSVEEFERLVAEELGLTAHAPPTP